MPIDISSERRVIEKVLEVNCRRFHFSREGYCLECKQLKDDLLVAANRCSKGEEKSYCEDCGWLCLNSSARENTVGLFNKTRLLLLIKHPWLSLRYCLSRVGESLERSRRRDN